MTGTWAMFVAGLQGRDLEAERNGPLSQDEERAVRILRNDPASNQAEDIMRALAREKGMTHE